MRDNVRAARCLPRHRAEDEREPRAGRNSKLKQVVLLCRWPANSGAQHCLTGRLAEMQAMAGCRAKSGIRAGRQAPLKWPQFAIAEQTPSGAPRPQLVTLVWSCSLDCHCELRLSRNK